MKEDKEAQKLIECFIDDELNHKEFMQVLSMLQSSDEWRELYEREKKFRRFVKNIIPRKKANTELISKIYDLILEN